MEIKELKQSPAFVAGLEMPEFNINAYLRYAEANNFEYHVYHLGQLIWSGKEYRPAMATTSTVDMLVELLNFFTTRPQDTDEEFFKFHTEDHLDWLQTCEVDELKYYLSLYEDKDPQTLEYFNDALTTA